MINPMLADIIQQGIVDPEEWDKMMKEFEEALKKMDSDDCQHVWEKIPLFTSIKEYCRICGIRRKGL